MTHARLTRPQRGGSSPRTARSVAWCSASIWSAPDGSGLLTLDASSVQTAPEGSSRIVWMIKRMIKRLGRCLAIEAPRRPGHKILNLVVDPHEVMRVTRALTPFPWTYGPGCADRARHGVRKRSSSRRHRPPRVRWAGVWPPPAAATPRLRPVGRSHAAPIASDGHVGRRTTTVCHSTTNRTPPTGVSAAHRLPHSRLLQGK
jgi:hypothetical protein